MKHYEFIESVLIHGGTYGDERTNAVSTPIYQTPTLMQDGLEKHHGYEYSRTGSPTREALEALIAELKGGEVGFAFASGTMVIATVLSLFQNGDRIMVSSNVYGETFHVLDQIFRRFGSTYATAGITDLKALEAVITPDVRAALVESPINPLLAVADLVAAVGITHCHGALPTMDNTFMAPYLQQPLELGADVVLHSAIKYLGDHSDVTAGLAVVKAKGLAERLHFTQNAIDGILQPFDSYLLIHSIKTLGMRMDRHVKNVEALTRLLCGHEVVKTVYYPGLPDVRGLEINSRQIKNGGAMVSSELDEGYDIHRFFQSLHLITLTESLGKVGSLVHRPASVIHASIPKEIHQKIGITDGLICFSVGIENLRDLIRDLRMSMEGTKV